MFLFNVCFFAQTFCCLVLSLSITITIIVAISSITIKYIINLLCLLLIFDLLASYTLTLHWHHIFFNFIFLIFFNLYLKKIFSYSLFRIFFYAFFYLHNLSVAIFEHPMFFKLYLNCDHHGRLPHVIMYNVAM